MADPKLRVEQILANEKFKKALKDSHKAASKFGQQMQQVGGMIAGAFAVSSIINYTKESMSAYADQIKSESKLITALKGRRDIADDLISQANKLQSITLFSDEDIINGQALLATFTQSEEQLKTLTPLILDYAQAFGMDVASAAKQVGKALINTNGAIGKSGIEAEGAAGSYERYSNLVQQLTDKFTGQAEGAIPEALKAQRELTVSIDELKESWGSMVTSIANLGLFKWISDELGYLKWGLDKIKTEGGGFKKWWNWFWQTGDFGSDVFESEKYYEVNKEQIDKNAKALGIGGDAAKTYADMVNESLKANNNAAPIIKKTTEELEKEAETAKKAAEAYQKLLEDKRKAAQGTEVDSMASLSSGYDMNVGLKLRTGVEQFSLPTDQVEEFDMALRDLPGTYAVVADEMEATSQRLESAFEQIGDAVGTALGEFMKGEAKFGDVATSLLQTIIKIVAGYLTESVAASFAGGASAGGPAAPFTGAAAAAAALSMFGALVPALMAKGGVVPLGYPNDSYPAMLSSREMVVPPNKLDSVFSNRTQNINVTGKIRGSDIYFVNEKQTSKLSRYR